MQQAINKNHVSYATYSDDSTMLNSDPTSIRIDSAKGQIIFKYQGSQPGIMILDLKQGTLAGINLKEQQRIVIQLSELLNSLEIKDDGIGIKEKLYMFGKKITNIFGVNDERPPRRVLALDEEEFEEVYFNDNTILLERY